MHELLGEFNHPVSEAIGVSDFGKLQYTQYRDQCCSNLCTVFFLRHYKDQVKGDMEALKRMSC